LKPGLADAQAAASRSCTAPSSILFGDAFFDSEIWAKLMADPSERMKLQQSAGKKRVLQSHTVYSNGVLAKSSDMLLTKIHQTVIY
jgi:hypothetical protein